MTGRIEGGGSLGAAAGAGGVGEAGQVSGATQASAREGESEAVVLSGGGEGPIGVSNTPGVPGDTARLGNLASALGFFTDPLAMQGLAQSMLRDTQVDSRETSIEANEQEAQASATERREAIAKAAAKAKEAEGWGLFAQIAVRVAAVAGAVAGVVGGAFTGGAGIVLAAGLIIMAFGNDLAFACKKAGVDADVTNAIGMGASIVGTACTLGAGAAGAGASAAAQGAALVAQQTAQALQVAGSLYGSMGSVAKASIEHRGTMLQADAAGWELEVEEANDNIDDDVEEAIAFMESFERVITRLRGAAEARDEAMRAATMQRA